MKARTKILLVALAAMTAAGPALAANPLTITKTLSVSSDPVDLALPKAIPGAVIAYTITVRNPNLATTPSNVVVTDSINTLAIPQGAEYYVGTGTDNPLVFSDGLAGLGVAGSGLTYTWTRLNSTTDSVAFSCDGGLTWTCTPSPDADGYDPAVTNIRVSFSNTFAVLGGFTLGLRVRVKTS